MDVGPPGTCIDEGRGQLRVTLELAPGLGVERGEVWLAAMCLGPDGERAVRVVRADPGGLRTTLAGLGTGMYVVRASALVSPGAVSAFPLSVEPDLTAITQLSLAPGEAPIATMRAPFGIQPSDAGTAVDAGVRDASAASDVSPLRDAGSTDVALVRDAGTPRREFTVRAPIVVRPASVDVIVGTLTALLEPRDASSFYATIRVRNSSCDTMMCTPIYANAAEIRVARAGEPMGLALAQFSPALVTVDREIMSARVILPGSLEAPDLSLFVSLFGHVGEQGTHDAGM